MKTASLFLFLVLLVISLPLPRQAQATLGEGADSVARDRQALSAVSKTTSSHANYTVQEVTTESATIREYLNLSGVVFAVAWNGLAHPDLNTLLGSFAGEYRAAKRQTERKRGQRRSRVQSGQVIVETWGHMRNLQGRAYLPALLPEGVSANEIN